MPFCRHCGHELPPTGRFCPDCGATRESTEPETVAETRPLAAADPTTAPTTSPAPAPTPSPQPAGRTLPPAATTTAAPSLPALDLSRLLVGNWLGASVVAASALLTSGVLSVVIALLGKPVDFGLDNSLTLVAVLMTGAFGADLTAELGVLGVDAEASIAAFPLTITVATLAVAVLVFRRVTAGYTRALDAVADAARASVILGLALMIIALVFRADSREFGRGWGAELGRSLDARIEFGASAAGAFGLGTLLMFVVLAAAAWSAVVGGPRRSNASATGWPHPCTAWASSGCSYRSSAWSGSAC